MRRVAEVSSFNLMYNLCLYYEKQKSYDKTELTFQPTLVQKEFIKIKTLLSFVCSRNGINITEHHQSINTVCTCVSRVK